MEQIFTEFSGRTTEEAIEEGLKQLGLAENEADIRVIEEAKKKLFGYSKARVEIARKIDLKTSNNAENNENATEETTAARQEDYEEKAEKRAEIHRDEQGRTDGERAVEFLEGIFDILKITACTELKSEGEKIEIEVTASNTHSVIGKRGVMLDALQTIAGAVANIGREEYKRVVVDCENYRETRETTLENLATKLADKAVRYEKKIKLEPMNPYERRIIHAALSENTEVTTESEGKDPYRYIVIIPKNVRYPDRPASPAYEEKPRRNNFNRDNNNGYRKPYNRDNNGYRKQYNRDNNNYNRDNNNNYNRDNREQNGEYRKPYNRDNNNGYRKQYNRDGYNRNNNYNRDNNYNRENNNYNRDNNNYNRENNYNRDNRDYNNRRNENDGERRDYKPRTSGNTGYKKTSSDFFGTYLGNSKDNKDE